MSVISGASLVVFREGYEGRISGGYSGRRSSSRSRQAACRIAIVKLLGDLEVSSIFYITMDKTSWAYGIRI